jgi:prepilin-type N-terminal cleavage/methylation domain-containing protein
MKLNNRGFSLIELMVVVGIIAILVAVVTPVYSSFSFKSRQVEAKASLAGLFSSQKTFFMQYGAYHTSFQALGFAPEGYVHYNVGFGDIGAVAGPAEGFNIAVDMNRINSQSFCGGVSGANVPGNACTLVNPTPALNPTFTAYPGGIGFTAGAMINKSIYGVQYEIEDLAPRFQVANAILRLALGSETSYAQKKGKGGSSRFQRPSISPDQELWVIDQDKQLYQITGD